MIAIACVDDKGKGFHTIGWGPGGNQLTLIGAIERAKSRATRGGRQVIRGLDVSAYQGSIAWPQTATQFDCAFAFVKVAEGDTGRDPRALANLTGARAAGLVVGSYAVARPSETSDPAAQARAHFGAAQAAEGLLWGDLPHCVDFEERGTLGDVALAAWLERHAAEWERLMGTPAILYTYPAFWQPLAAIAGPATGRTALWWASYGADSGATPTTFAPPNPVPLPWRSARFWQWTDRGRLPQRHHSRLRPVRRVGRRPAGRVPERADGGARVDARSARRDAKRSAAGRGGVMAPWPAPLMAATFATTIYASQTATTIIGQFEYQAAYESTLYRDAREFLDDIATDTRRWMRGSFPPPVELALAVLPELPPAAPAEAAWSRRYSGRVVARSRRRRPLRGRAGRPHNETT